MYTKQKIRDIFGPIWGASGTQNFFGEGWSYHHWPILSRLISFDGVTFVAKTTTINKRERAEGGNMDLRQVGDSWLPKKLFPDCIHISLRSWIQGAMMNAVGLSGPGAAALLETEQWQKETKPFMLSFMSVAKTPEEQLAEFIRFRTLFLKELPNFEFNPGLQINLSCPNVGKKGDALLASATPILDNCMSIEVPIGIKVSVTMPPDTVAELAKHSACSFVVSTNTVPWGQLPERINWQRLFGTTESPLKKYGGGGLSGKPLFPILVDWIKEFRQLDPETHVNAGGGIIHPDNVVALRDVGADTVSLGTTTILRPWRFKGIVKKAHEIL